jgi:hypothetical protein
MSIRQSDVATALAGSLREPRLRRSRRAIGSGEHDARCARLAQRAIGRQLVFRHRPHQRERPAAFAQVFVDRHQPLRRNHRATIWRGGSAAPPFSHAMPRPSGESAGLWVLRRCAAAPFEQGRANRGNPAQSFPDATPTSPDGWRAEGDEHDSSCTAPCGGSGRHRDNEPRHALASVRAGRAASPCEGLRANLSAAGAVSGSLRLRLFVRRIWRIRRIHQPGRLLRFAGRMLIRRRAEESTNPLQ